MKIELEDYVQTWPNLFVLEKIAILNAVGPWIKAIEHIGSTSIPSMTAKPTIDICIGVSSLEEADQYIINALQQLGFEYVQALEKDIPERRYLQKLSNNGNHLVHLHIVIINHELWNNHINFRDYLIMHPEASKAYIALKIALKEKFAYDRKAYTMGKSDFIRAVLAAATKVK